LKQISLTADDLYAYQAADEMKGIPFKTFRGTSAIGILQHPKCWFSSLHLKVGSHQQANLSEVPTEFHRQII
jgi:hypothetical protein